MWLMNVIENEYHLDTPKMLWSKNTIYLMSYYNTLHYPSKIQKKNKKVFVQLKITKKNMI